MAFPNDVVTIPPGTRSFTEGSTDIVKATAELLIKRGQFTNLLSDLTEYTLLKHIMPKHKKVFDGGLDWTFEAAIANNNSGNGTAKFVGMYESDTYGDANVLVQGKVSPRFLTANYVYDKREPVLNSGRADATKILAIVEFIKLKMELMYQSAYDKLETVFSGVGPTYADDKKTPHGLAFYIQKQSNSDAATSGHANGAFDGKDPKLPASSTSNTPTACPRSNIATTTYSRWANWAAQYANVSKADLVKKMRIAAHKINFKSPLSLTDPTLSTGRSILTTLNVIGTLEEVLEDQNMNLGNDIASKDGKVLFKGAPVEYVPALDTDAQDPIYMIDWKTLCFGTVAGWDKKVTAPKEDNAAHNTMKGFLDMSCEMVCTNLRNQAVIAKASA